jgi:hypothetical protein
MLKRPLSLVVILHQDLAEHDRHELFETYFSWLEEEMENISTRPMAIVLVRPSEAPDLSSYNYKNSSSSAALAGWAERVDDYLLKRYKDKNIRINRKLNKYLLLTRTDINSDIAGVAQRGGHVGIASITVSNAPAHEVGHMFNATHEDADILYNGWWSETPLNTPGFFTPLRLDAQRFSDNNREIIRQYLEKA